MIRNVMIILSLVLLTACEYDYIHNNPYHPQEYIGKWICDSVYVNGVKNNNAEKRDFSIMQTEVDISMATDAHGVSRYNNWQIDETQTTFTLLNTYNVKMLSYEIVQKPYNLALKLDNTIYYLSH